MSHKKMQKAAAIRYEEAKDMAPKVVAKGKGHIAEQIIRLARQNGIPLYEDPNLVNVLESLKLDTEIPTELYRAVAEVLVLLYRLNGKGEHPE